MPLLHLRVYNTVTLFSKCEKTFRESRGAIAYHPFLNSNPITRAGRFDSVRIGGVWESELFTFVFFVDGFLN